MPEFGFPAQPRQTSMARLIANLRNQGDAERTATVTGRHDDITRARSGRVNEVLQLEKSIADLAAYSEIIALSEARASTMQASLNTIMQTGQALTDTADLLQTNGTDANFETVSQQARGDLGTISAALNVEFAGRALFAGDDADTQAVATDSAIYAASVPFLEGEPTAADAYAALETEFNTPGATYDTAFYLGGDARAPASTIAPGERVSLDVRADEGAFRKVMFNTTVLAAAFDPANAIPDNQRRALIALGSAGLRSAISEMTSVQARLGLAEARIGTVKARNIATESALTLQFNDLAGKDSYTAAVNLSQIEDQLETAFATTARMTQLSLASRL